MNNNQGTLLFCPNPHYDPQTRHEHRAMIGSIAPNGKLVIKRKFGYTIITAMEFDLMCDCGYQVRYAGGVVTSLEVTPLPLPQ